MANATSTVSIAFEKESLEAMRGLTEALNRQDGENLHYDEETLEKVYGVILSYQLDDGTHLNLDNATEIIGALQNAGILFRERAE